MYTELDLLTVSAIPVRERAAVNYLMNGSSSSHSSSSSSSSGYTCDDVSLILYGSTAPPTLGAQVPTAALKLVFVTSSLPSPHHEKASMTLARSAPFFTSFLIRCANYSLMLLFTLSLFVDYSSGIYFIHFFYLV